MTPETIPAAALVERLQKQPHDAPCPYSTRNAELQERHGCTCWIGRAVEFIEAADASLHAQAEPPAPTIAEMVAALPLGWNKGHPLMPGGTYATDSVCVDTGWLTQVIALLSELRKTKEPVPSSATTIARERAYAFQWCLEHAAREDGRREDCRECQLPAQNLRDAIAAVQGSQWVIGVDWGKGESFTAEMPAPATTGDRALIDTCPFCRGKVRVIPDGSVTFVECDTCLAAGPSRERRDDAVREWNRVALPARPGAAESPTEKEKP